MRVVEDNVMKSGLNVNENSCARLARIKVQAIYFLFLHLSLVTNLTLLRIALSNWIQVILFLSARFLKAFMG